MPFDKQLPQGVSDLYSNDYEKKEYVIGQINQLTKLYGFKPIQTPTFEYYDLFMSMPNTLDTDQMIKLIDHDGKILVLRPDATIPIARMVASSADKKPFERLSYVTNIFRMQNGESDVFSRSFTQLGVECFKEKDAYVDVEMIVLAIESLQAIGVERFQIDLGQAKFFQSLLKTMNLTPADERLIQEKLEQKNESELEQVLGKYKIDKKSKNVLMRLTDLFGNPLSVVNEAKSLALNDDMREAIYELEWVVQQLEELNLADYISVDLGLVNNLNYYTGLMFQGYVHGFGRSIIQGGRYDRLTEEFGLPMDAIGFGVYIDQLIDVLEKQHHFLKHETIQVGVHSEKTIEAFQVARQLRQAGMVVNLFSYETELNVDLDQKLIQLRDEHTPFESTEDLIDKVGHMYGKN
ncbi:ATP phosphoribosyltransferase regulatory subunit [Aquisalibacillus elongatus]|uniref:ATP phosphoribosyltransferase regulatory subunit n=1 Tax=Aquisalibacillus elongatus TaxID=485577 RepID=A0A3N5BK99_9BACI|nr:ATP phosphoribosyltransferase regulatory subunit [Aquisalibacillus elongatus]RPF57059.1 ATP phosphoribosyltransferase regulatory subunit [Aquisalibacillus elongatus]